MSAQDLEGRVVMVVGASNGVGRAVAQLAVTAGARVAFCARRADRLADAVAEAGGGLAVAGDIADAEECRRMVGLVKEAFGPIDLVLHAAAIGSIIRMEHCEAEEWTRLISVNFLGFNLLCRAAVPAMAEGGLVTALSSDSVGFPREALGPYGATKAALEQSVLAWRLEHPELRFSVVTIGGTMPTGFGDEFDPEVLAQAMDGWLRWGQMQRRQMATDELAEVLIDLLGTVTVHPGVAMEHVRLRHPSDPARTFEELLDEMPS